MLNGSYLERRGELEAYFDRTAVEAWKKLTSDAPVGRIRATVRAGRDRMRDTLLAWLPENLTGRRILDAGCGTGALAVAAAARGAEVVAVDLSPTLVALARERASSALGTGTVTFMAGDMLDATHGDFDHVVAMDSFIHYRTTDIVKMLERLAPRVSRSVLFTVAPRTPALAMMHGVGRFFPKGNRAPGIVPVGAGRMQRLLDRSDDLAGWQRQRSQRIDSGFYISQAQELVRQ